MITQTIINQVYEIKMLMGNPFAFYKINDNTYFVSIERTYNWEQLVQFFKNNIYTLE